MHLWKHTTEKKSSGMGLKLYLLGRDFFFFISLDFLV